MPSPTSVRSIILTATSVSALCALGACGSQSTGRARPKLTRWQPIETEDQRRTRLISELEDDILLSYSDDDSHAFASRLINSSLMDANVGSARIGVDPSDIVIRPLIDPQSWRRWPLVILPSATTVVRSKRLRVRLSADQKVESAWMSDELSWRVNVCGKMAAVPLRITALFAHDGDRWYEVFEHVSFGWTPSGHHRLRGARIRDAFSSDQLAAYPNGELGAPLAKLLSGDRDRIASVVVLEPLRNARLDGTQAEPTFILGPGLENEWDSAQDTTRLDLGVRSVRPEEGRVGLIGTRGAVGYWIGNFIATRRSTSVRLRGTFIFEKRCSTKTPKCQPDKWFIVQGHLSEAIDDHTLATHMFGSAVRSVSPLRFDCTIRRQQPPIDDAATLLRTNL
jgi:hypothetical protein